MSKEVQDFEAFIRSDAKNSLLIQDEKTGKKIDHKFTADKLQEYGDLKSYLSHLYDNGHQVLVVTKRRKNGNTDSQVRNTVARKLTLNKTKEADPSDLSSKPAQNAGGPTPNNIQPMQATNTQSEGMTAANMAKLYADSERYQDFKRWYEQAAAELKEKKDELEKTKEKWKEKYDDLKDSFNNFKHEKRTEEKPGTIEKLVNAITERPELLSSLMQALPQNIKQNQLPQNQSMQGVNQLDETSQSAAIAINNLTDNDKQTIVDVINHYALGSEKFIPELQQLVETYSDELNEAMQQHTKQSA